MLQIWHGFAGLLSPLKWKTPSIVQPSHGGIPAVQTEVDSSQHERNSQQAPLQQKRSPSAPHRSKLFGVHEVSLTDGSHISQSFTDQGVNISQAHCRATDDGRAVNTFHALVRDLDQLKQVIRSLSRIKGVYSVDRVTAEALG